MPIRPSRTAAALPGSVRAQVLGADAELDRDRATGRAQVRAASRGAPPRLSATSSGPSAPTTAAGRKFIAGEPMKEATNLFAGRW